MSYYTEAIAGMPGLLLDIREPMANYTKDMYEGAFQQYYDKNCMLFESLENGYNSVIDKEQYIENMANALGDAAVRFLDGISKRGDRQAKLLDFNFALAAYVFPAVLKYGGNSSRPLAEAVHKVWKEHFPKTNVHISDYDGIMKGFKRKSCYITTAVCETFKKPDDCYELTLLRDYRDNYLMNQEEGEEIVQEYYNLAPTIVKHINKKRDSKKIYAEIWSDYLSPCISLIEEGKNEECQELYVKMVRGLQKLYF